MSLKLPTHGRVKERYNPTPSAAEKRFHLALMNQPCAACGIDPCGVFHHLLTETPEKRWKRDHEMGIELCDTCHRELHADGDEWAWCMARGFDPVGIAVGNRAWGREKGLI